MLNIFSTGGRFRQIALIFPLVAALVSCNTGTVDEETFSLYLNERGYDELLSTMHSYALRHDYHVTEEVLNGTSPSNTSRLIMLEGGGIRVLIQSALAEQCEEREGRRDVEYSNRVFDVNAFSTIYSQSNADLSIQVKQLKDILVTSGFRVVSKSESCDLL